MKIFLLKNNKFFIFLISSLILTYYFQNLINLEGDVSYLIYITQLLFKGATYGKEIFETNPPMILYLYSPVALLAKYSSISVAIIFRGYMLVLIGASISLSYFLLKKIINEPIVLFCTLLGIMTSLLILPLDQFGQREHLFLTLLLPYIFAIACELENKSLPNYLFLLLNVAAGIGICIKPYFLFIFLAVILFQSNQKKMLFGWLNIGSIAILLIMFTYLVSTYYFFPGYFHTVLPLVTRYYFPGIAESTGSILSDPLMDLFLWALIPYLIFRKSDRYPILGGLLVSSLFGSIFTFLATSTTWYLHLLPAICFSIILLFFASGQLLSSFIFNKKLNYLIRFVSGIIILVINYQIISPAFAFSIYYSRSYLTNPIMIEQQQISSYLLSQSGRHSINCFSFETTRDCFPLVINSGSTFGSRYPFFWWLRALIFFPDKKAYDFFSKSVAEDLNSFKPRWILIKPITAKAFLRNGFDYITYFSNNDDFRKAWKHYHVAKEFRIYTLYERLD